MNGSIYNSKSIHQSSSTQEQERTTNSTLRLRCGCLRWYAFCVCTVTFIARFVWFTFIGLFGSSFYIYMRLPFTPDAHAARFARATLLFTFAFTAFLPFVCCFMPYRVVAFCCILFAFSTTFVWFIGHLHIHTFTHDAYIAYALPACGSTPRSFVRYVRSFSLFLLPFCVFVRLRFTAFRSFCGRSLCYFYLFLRLFVAFVCLRLFLFALFVVLRLRSLVRCVAFLLLLRCLRLRL